MSNLTTAIKRNQVLIQFSLKHHFGLLLVWKIRQDLIENIAPERISDYVVFLFENELREYLKEEEKAFCSELPGCDSLHQRAFVEHEKIYSLIEDIRKDKENNNLLKEFAETLYSHIRFEERTLHNNYENFSLKEL